VSAIATDGNAEISIRDAGRGIPGALLNRIFEPFFTTTSEGTGLGLAIARQIAIAHAGSLTIDSQEGVGTTTRVLLPLLPSEPAIAVKSDRLVTK
jgi:signal transduction histidine kinase